MEFKKTGELLKKYKIPYCKSFLCRTPEQAKNACKKIGFPVVLKISSPDIIHKSDIDAVKTNIRNEEELLKSFVEILKNVKKKKPRAKIEGIILQKQKTGKEIIIGVKKDAQFGYVIMFGLGGIFVEVFKDVSFRISPVDKKGAQEMIKEIKSYEILKGIRGEKSVNIDALADMIVKISRLAEKENKIAEMDFNPVIVNQKSAEVVDARIIKK